ncbi:P-loop containing nucleoside triphosphate hydrolase protein [Biscogniauxia sp. FL1348]|nr:P-loop containing nucleoside triphosphate hydrolase protein [Biscogniauxia sp. FL1348]
MLPIISLLGIMCSGKGTLGPLVAAEFKLYHISIGDLLRAVCSPPIQEAGEHINKMVENGELVPGELIDTLGRSAALAVRIHNYRVMRDIVPSRIAFPILQEKIMELEAEGTYRGVLLDGFPRQLDHCEEARELCFGPEFPTLVIYIDCPVEVARRRYLARARDGDTAASFDKRLAQFEEHMPSLLRKFADEGILVSTVNEGSMTIDETYEALVTSLRAKHGMPL